MDISPQARFCGQWPGTESTTDYLHWLTLMGLLLDTCVIIDWLTDPLSQEFNRRDSCWNDKDNDGCSIAHLVDLTHRNKYPPRHPQGASALCFPLPSRTGRHKRTVVGWQFKQKVPANWRSVWLVLFIRWAWAADAYGADGFVGTVFLGKLCNTLCQFLHKLVDVGVVCGRKTHKQCFLFA